MFRCIPRTRTRQILRRALERVLDEIETIVAPEYLAIHIKSRRSERTAGDRLVGIGAQLVFDLVTLDRRRIDSRAFEHLTQRFFLADVATLRPDRAEHRRMILGKSFLAER